mgnify:CR=1 FL=1
MALSLMAGVIVLVAAVLLSHVTDEKRTQHSATALVCGDNNVRGLN